MPLAPIPKPLAVVSPQGAFRSDYGLAGGFHVYPDVGRQQRLLVAEGTSKCDVGNTGASE